MMKNCQGIVSVSHSFFLSSPHCSFPLVPDNHFTICSHRSSPCRPSVRRMKVRRRANAQISASRTEKIFFSHVVARLATLVVAPSTSRPNLIRLGFSPTGRFSFNQCTTAVARTNSHATRRYARGFILVDCARYGRWKNGSKSACCVGMRVVFAHQIKAGEKKQRGKVARVFC